jgi:hypothetical protein
MKSLLQGLCNEQSRPSLKPEERLLLAVVESAYWDLQSPDAAKRRTASTYFLDDKDHHAFSFVAICQHFSWSPVSIRFQLGAILGKSVEDGQLRVETAPISLGQPAAIAVR